MSAELGKAPLSISLGTSFYERNREIIGDYLGIHGVDPRLVEDTKDLDGLVRATQPWARGDHARPDMPIDITDSQSGYLHRLHESFGMKHAIELPKGDYDFLVVLGGMHTGNHRRIEWAKKILNSPGVNVDRMVMLGGERGVYPESESNLIAKNIEEIKKSEQTDPFLKKVVNGTAEISNESDMLRLASRIQLGKLILRPSNKPDVIEFDWDGMPITLIHTKSVPRPLGAPRHTTEGCVSDLITNIKPSHSATIGFIATNPHTERTSRSARRTMAGLGRTDIELVPSGPHALDSYSHALYRGEVARNLYEDLSHAASI